MIVFSALVWPVAAQAQHGPPGRRPLRITTLNLCNGRPVMPGHNISARLQGPLIFVQEDGTGQFWRGHDETSERHHSERLAQQLGENFVAVRGADCAFIYDRQRLKLWQVRRLELPEQSRPSTWRHFFTPSGFVHHVVRGRRAQPKRTKAQLVELEVVETGEILRVANLHLDAVAPPAHRRLQADAVQQEMQTAWPEMADDLAGEPVEETETRRYFVLGDSNALMIRRPKGTAGLWFATDAMQREHLAQLVQGFVDAGLEDLHRDEGLPTFYYRRNSDPNHFWWVKWVSKALAILAPMQRIDVLLTGNVDAIKHSITDIPESDHQAVYVEF